MPEPTSPRMIADLVANISRLYDQHPEELGVVHDLVRERLEAGGHGASKDAWVHVTDHLSEIFPALMLDERMVPVQETLAAAYERLPVTPETRVRRSADENSIFVAVAVASGILLAGSAIVVAYCLGGPDPAPGESVEVRC